MFPSRGKKRLTKANSDVTLSLGLFHEDVRDDMTIVAVEIKENTFTMNEKIGNFGKQKILNISKWMFRMEKYNIRYKYY